jgi:hypothetical protein
MLAQPSVSIVVSVVNASSVMHIHAVAHCHPSPSNTVVQPPCRPYHPPLLQMPPPSPLPCRIQAYMWGAWYHGRPPTARAQPTSTRHKSATQHKLVGARAQQHNTTKVPRRTAQHKCTSKQAHCTAQHKCTGTRSHSTSAQHDTACALPAKRTT